MNYEQSKRYNWNHLKKIQIKNLIIKRNKLIEIIQLPIVYILFYLILFVLAILDTLFYIKLTSLYHFVLLGH